MGERDLVRVRVRGYFTLSRCQVEIEVRYSDYDLHMVLGAR